MEQLDVSVDDNFNVWWGKFSPVYRNNKIVKNHYNESAENG